MRFLCALLILTLLPGGFALAEAVGEAPSVDAAGAILIERESGRVLFEKDADKPAPMASTTKVMTALLTLEKCDPEEMVTAGPNASGVPGTSIYLGVGEQLTVQQMLEGMMLRSGNDAAVALAEHIGGSVENFAALMNERAKQLGADAHFVTPNGLDAAGHLATARAMALIANEAMDYPMFREIVSTTNAVLPWRDSPYDRVLTNKNKLLSTYKGATGIKTGFTKKAGRCLIFSALRDDMEVIGVVLNCGTWFDTAQTLMDWGFQKYQMKSFLYPGQRVAELSVQGGVENRVYAAAPKNLRVPVADDESVRMVIHTDSILQAPVTEGTPVGVAQILSNGKVLAEQILVTEKTIEKRTFRAGLRRVLHFFHPAA